MIRLLLVDDQSIVREGLASLLQTQPDIEIIGEAENGKVAVERSLLLQPDVILMDIRMPIMDGVAAIKLLTAECGQRRHRRPWARCNVDSTTTRN